MRIIARIGEQPRHQPVGFPLDPAHMFVLAPVALKPGIMAEHIMRQLMRDQRGEQRFLRIAEGGKTDPDHHPRAIGDRPLAIAHQFEAGGANLDRLEPHFAAIGKTQRDGAMFGQHRLDMVMRPHQPLPVHRLARRPGIGIEPFEADDLDMLRSVIIKVASGRAERVMTLRIRNSGISSSRIRPPTMANRSSIFRDFIVRPRWRGLQDGRLR